ncbi:GNAT family N-acetyltransferase [Qaidamihabitans albus]|uniref:GNAT family N-acetyltransferase n=1 Tax=Qaidamihabitans albus TaxID=2795733 RepID=UPI0018F10AB0|nr:GNAT family N-acetyltransferase [Qaidamihabitans albus]
MTGAADPLLPPVPEVPEGERLGAVLADGREVTGVLYRARHDGWDGLWRARESWELTPLLGDTGGAGMAALLSALRRRLDQEAPGTDSACVVTWPSRDMPVARTLLGHGLVPYTVLGVRGPEPVVPAPAAGVTVRPATEADIGELLELWLAELRYSALVGPGRVPEDAAGRLGNELRRALQSGDPVWLAESTGVAAGLAVCGRPAPAPRRLAAGRWGQVGTVSVAATARGTGIGRALMAVVHRDLLARGARGTFLFYSPHNALASVFWHRQGYRPLWTTWEVRPAAALR